MTKREIVLLVGITVLLVAVVPVPAYAWWHGPHVRIGGPFWYPYPYPYYAPPPVVVQPSAPIVVEPSQPQTYVQPGNTGPAESSWYYCESAKGYYPYVKECPGGWLRVAPHPAS